MLATALWLSLVMFAPLAAGQAPRSAEPLAAPAGDTDTDTAVVCELELRNLPATLRQNGDYRLRFSDQRPNLAVPRSGGLALEVDSRTHVWLEGPAYYGEVELSPASCASTSPPVLEARPRPAQLQFQTSISLEELIINCVEGCPHRWTVASRFPTIALADDQTERFIKLEFKARGRRARVVSLRVTPGENVVRVALDPIEGS